MNSSLSPDDKLGRMLHTFTTTATEIADCEHNNLIKYAILSSQEPDIKRLQTKTIDLNENRNYSSSSNEEIFYIKCENMRGNDDKINITY
jgi:hypothetical protein